MKLKRDIATKLISLKRNVIFWILCIICYYVLALADMKSYFFINNYEQAIYRCNFQQVFIVFLCVFIVHITFHENELQSIKDYKIIYAKNIKQEMYSYLLTNMIVNIGAFLSGQLIASVVNIMLGGEIFVKLLVANFLIVSMEITAAILFIMAFRMIFRKDIVVYGVYYVLIIASLIWSNVYVSIPLTINIVGIEEQAYYVSFGKALWIGRIILVLSGSLFFILGAGKFERDCIKES